MIILLFILLLILFISETTNFKYKKESFIGILIAFVILEASKWESGIDFYNCYNHFQTVLLPNTHSQYEILYNAIVYVFALLKFPYHLYLFFFFTVVYVLYYFAISKFSEYRLTVFLFLFCITIGLMGSNRQIMALAIGIFATAYFLPQKKLYFLLLIITAGFIHQSAFFYLPLVFMGSKINFKWWAFLFLFAAVIQVLDLSKPVFDYMVLPFGPELSAIRVHYYNQIEPEDFNYWGFTFGVIRRLIPVLLLVYFKDKFVNRPQYFLILNILCFSVFIYILLYHDLEYVISRIGVYYLVFEAVAYSWFIPIIKKSKNKYFFISVFILYATFLLYKNTSQYPELFFPFKTIFGSF